MKTRNRVIQMLMTLALFAGLANTSPLYAAPVPGAPASTTTAQTTATTPKFDGHVLYEAAFQALFQYHITLADPDTRSRWAAVWQHKHDQDGMLDTEAGTDKAILEMMHSLGQRFDYYLNAEQTQQEEQEIDSSLVGVGVQMLLKNKEAIIKAAGDKPTTEQKEKAVTVSDDNPLLVREVLEDSPAEKAGLKSGDMITKIDGLPVNGMNQDTVVTHVRGKENSIVTITVERQDSAGANMEITFSIKRGKIIAHVVHFKKLDNGISYIKLDNFMSQYCKREMLEAFMKSASGKGVIIDLRGNPGGRVDYNIDMLERIVPEGTLIVLDHRKGDEIISDRSMLEEHFLISDAPSSSKPGERELSTQARSSLQLPEDMPMVVLVDQNSYSCSEMMSGILQHCHRALIIGVPTGGKGVGQNVIPLPFGRLMHVTSLRFRPGGADMDWVGIIPDIEVSQSKNENEDKQLDAAVAKLKELIAAKEARDVERQDLKTKHENEFKQQQSDWSN